MDALSDVLRVVRLTGGIFLHADFSAPWCISTRIDPEFGNTLLNGAEELILFHYVHEGTLLVKMEGGKPTEIGPGHAVLFTRNNLHVMGSALDRTPVPSTGLVQAAPESGLFRIVHGGGGPATRIVCGFLGFESKIANPLAAALPPMLVLNVLDGPAGRWTHETLRFVADQEAVRAPGLQTVLTKLSEVLFVDAVRRYIETIPEGHTGWLAGLRDPVVGKALSLLHGDVARNWTVEELGREAGASRSVLSERFSCLIGEPPMQYLASWRMRLAAEALREGRKPLVQVAADVGYESQAAFIRAFRREFGAPPAAWRRAHRSSEAAAG